MFITQYPRQFSCGIPTVDAVFGAQATLFSPGLIQVTAANAMGKTAVLAHLAAALIKQDQKVLFICFQDVTPRAMEAVWSACEDKPRYIGCKADELSGPGECLFLAAHTWENCAKEMQRWEEMADGLRVKAKPTVIIIDDIAAAIDYRPALLEELRQRAKDHQQLIIVSRQPGALDLSKSVEWQADSHCLHCLEASDAVWHISGTMSHRTLHIAQHDWITGFRHNAGEAEPLLVASFDVTLSSSGRILTPGADGQPHVPPLSTSVAKWKKGLGI